MHNDCCYKVESSESIVIKISTVPNNQEVFSSDKFCLLPMLLLLSIMSYAKQILSSVINHGVQFDECSFPQMTYIVMCMSPSKQIFFYGFEALSQGYLCLIYYS